LCVAVALFGRQIRHRAKIGLDMLMEGSWVRIPVRVPLRWQKGNISNISNSWQLIYWSLQ